MMQDKDLKLVKCTNCGKAFYIKTQNKGSLVLRCPYCEQDVKIKINDKKYGSS